MADGNSKIRARGRCICGSVRYEVRGPLRDVAACHCTECRRVTGSIFHATAARHDDVTIHDKALKVLFVEYEPTWEWRFVKEVFYRDKLVGREGFRTFLRSADSSQSGVLPRAVGRSGKNGSRYSIVPT